MHVQCYSGMKGDERPVRFEMGNHHYVVQELLDQWYGTDATYFKVLADDGNFYILRHDGTADTWSLEAYRRR